MEIYNLENKQKMEKILKEMKYTIKPQANNKTTYLRFYGGAVFEIEFLTCELSFISNANIVFNSIINKKILKAFTKDLLKLDKAVEVIYG